MIELMAGKLALVLDPQTGGAIASFRSAGVALLRPVADARLHAQGGRAVAAYPLIPFANRIAWGRFAHGGETFQLALNFGDHPHTIHGNAWMRSWAVCQASARRAHLTLDHRPPPAGDDPAGEWPFAYHAEQVFELDEPGLSVTLSLHNRDTRAWPAGLGLHPYVARTAQTILRFAADTVWTNDGDALPLDETPLPASLTFETARDIGTEAIDNCFAGWGGCAEIWWPEHRAGLRLTAAPPLDHLQIYTPAGQDFLGLEPVSNMPDAINRMETVADQGLVVLAPGEGIRATVRFSIIESAT